MQRETKSGKQSSEEQTANLEGQVHPFYIFRHTPFARKFDTFLGTFFIDSSLQTVWYKLQSVLSNSCRIECLFETVLNHC